VHAAVQGAFEYPMAAKAIEGASYPPAQEALSHAGQALEV